MKKGLKKLETQSPGSQIQYDLANIGRELLMHRSIAKEKGTMGIENILTHVVANTGPQAWLADMYSRYMSLQRRQVDPIHSQTGDIYQERNVKNKERMCQVTSAVVNGLVPYWGVYSSLIYNALQGRSTTAS